MQTTDKAMSTTVQTDPKVLKIRNIVSSVYDIQKVRIAVGNRIVNSFNIQLGQEPSKPKDDMGEEAKKMIKVLMDEYERVTDAYVEHKSSLKKIIREHSEDLDLVHLKSETDYKMIEQYSNFKNIEDTMIKVLKKELADYPVYAQYLSNVKGVGPLMAGVLISYFDPYAARHVSSFWKYAGLDVVFVPDNDAENPVGLDGELLGHYEGRQRKHTEFQDYIAKDGTKQQKKGLTYNPFVKTKLLGVLGTSFLRVRGDYAAVYYDYRSRLDNSSKHKDKTDGHKHRMATRYMVKQFLRNFWVEWRQIEGLPVTEPYEVAKLGNDPHKYNVAHHMAAQNSRSAAV